jgi:hypothetical protein
MSNLILRVVPVIFLLVSTAANAATIDIQQYSAFLHSQTLGPSSLEYTQLGNVQDDMTAAGLSVSFVNSLDAENLGTVSWSITNNTGAMLQDASFFVFLDAEIVQTLNNFYNESGAVASVTGAGAGDNLADSWEIDEPGYLFGDIYNNLLSGALDNSNGVPAGFEDDVSLALGFDLGDLVADAVVTGVFEFGRQDIGGLIHIDADSNETLFFNGTVDVTSATTVPEPPISLLFATSFLLLAFKKRKHS